MVSSWGEEHRNSRVRFCHQDHMLCLDNLGWETAQPLSVDPTIHAARVALSLAVGLHTYGLIYPILHPFHEAPVIFLYFTR